ncbi:MAG: TonB-dependent receptor [Rhodospirillaceae bacterium]|nr:TonB-dependent receptor [Rhodospirillaceae bacterium]
MRRTFGAAVLAAAAITVPATAEPAAVSAPSAIDEITVIGSRLKGERAASPSPVVTITASDLAAAGFTTPADVVRTLSVNTGSEFNTDVFTQNLSVGTSNFNLRGLGLNATLVLLNGRRQTISGGLADDGSTFVDLNALIPLIALERLDVLKDGAAALYGTDAVAGVADFVTRKNFTGVEAQVDYANTANSSQDDLLVSGIAGGGLGNVRGMAAASYLRRSWLPTSQRDYTKGKAFSSFGQPGAFILLERSPAFPDLPFGLANNQPIIDPNCAAGGGIPSPRNPQPAGVTSGVVGTCLFDFSSYYHLVPRERRWNTYASGELNADNGVTLYTEAAYAKADALRGTSPSFPLLNSPIVPANNPGNIFGVPVLFLGRAQGAANADETVTHTSDTWRGVVGARGDLRGWTWDVGATHSENDFLVGINNDLTDRFIAALNGRGGPNNNQFFNPFGSALRAQPGQATYNDPRVIDDFNSTITYDYRTRLTTLDAILSGDVVETAHGAWGLAVGGQYRHEKVIGDLDDQFNRENYIFFFGGPDFAGARDVWAAFAEARGPLSRNLEAQVALRHENTGGEFSSTDPKIGLTWSPLDWLRARGSYGTAFRAPSVFQAFSIQSVQQDILDPLTGTRGFRAVRSLGAANLKPEEADTSNLGVTLTPFDGFSASADYWRFDYTDIIVKQGAQALVNANPNDPRITRATGQILRIDTSYINASKALTDGLDLALSQAWSMPRAGDFTISADATWISQFIIRDTPASPRRNVAGNRNFNTFARSLPNWRGNAALSWALDGHSAYMMLRFISAYDDDQNANRRIKSQTTLDLQYGHSFKGNLLGEGRNVALSIGALNVFNQDPPNVITNAGYDSKIHDPRGRVLYVRLKTAWQ